MRFGLREDTINEINQVFANYPMIEKVVIYGSRVKGNYKHGSDIDLTLWGEALELEILNRIDNELDDLLLPYSFDLSIFALITNAELIEHINRVGVVFYERKRTN